MWDQEEFEKKEDKDHIKFIKLHCFKGCTKEPISDEDARFFYYDFIKERMLYHYPEDSETIALCIDCYNYFNKWE